MNRAGGVIGSPSVSVFDRGSLTVTADIAESVDLVSRPSVKVVAAMQTRCSFRRPLSLWALLISALVLGSVSSASATIITFPLNIEFSGGDEPASATLPWVTVTIDDSFGGADTVRLTIEATNLTGGKKGENINTILLNFDPVFDASLLTFTAVDNSDSVPTLISSGNDLYMADGDGFFDIFIEFPPPTGPNSNLWFTGGESVIYDLTYISAISAASFDQFSVMGGGTGVFQASAQILSINGTGSGWIGAIPEPGTGILLGLGMLGLGWRRQNRE